MTGEERRGNPHLSVGQRPQRMIADVARHVMRSTAYAVVIPENSLLRDPVEGNVAALLMDRVARLAGVARTDEDGPADALAAHLASASIGHGRGMALEWSPGWPDAADDPGIDVVRYSHRMYMLDDRQLAAELLEQARDARTRLGVSDGPDAMAMTLWNAIPAMSGLFGGVLQPDEAASLRPVIAELDDQSAFEVASAIVARGASETSVDTRMTIGDRALFAEPASGSTAGMLLDRLAVVLGAERGGTRDPTGFAVSSSRPDLHPSSGSIWSPVERNGVRPSPAVAAAHAGLGHTF